MLKPQDVVLVLKLICKEKENWSQGSLSQELVMSASEVNAGIKRLSFAGLIEKQDDDRRWQVIKPALKEFLVHGLKYVFPAEKGAPSIGIPTSIGAKPLKSIVDTSDMTPVWPDKGGKEKGYIFVPLYPTAPKAALNDPELYEWLCLVDALRDHDCEESEIIQVTLSEKLSGRKALVEAISATESAVDDQQLDLLSL